MIMEPEIGKEYSLVKVSDEGTKKVAYIRHNDGSASVFGDETIIFEPGAWKKGWQHLRDAGYESIND